MAQYVMNKKRKKRLLHHILAYQIRKDAESVLTRSDILNLNELTVGVNIKIYCLHDKDGTGIDSDESPQKIFKSVKATTKGNDECNNNIENEGDTKN